MIARTERDWLGWLGWHPGAAPTAARGEIPLAWRGDSRLAWRRARGAAADSDAAGETSITGQGHTGLPTDIGDGLAVAPLLGPRD